MMWYQSLDWYPDVATINGADQLQCVLSSTCLLRCLRRHKSSRQRRDPNQGLGDTSGCHLVYAYSRTTCRHPSLVPIHERRRWCLEGILSLDQASRQSHLGSISMPWESTQDGHMLFLDRDSYEPRGCRCEGWRADLCTPGVPS